MIAEDVFRLDDCEACEQPVAETEPDLRSEYRGGRWSFYFEQNLYTTGLTKGPEMLVGLAVVLLELVGFEEHVRRQVVDNFSLTPRLQRYARRENKQYPYLIPYLIPSMPTLDKVPQFIWWSQR